MTTRINPGMLPLSDPPTPDESIAVADMMMRHGGGFVQALGLALLRSDADNQQRIKAAWPEYWRKYAEMAEGQPT